MADSDQIPYRVPEVEMPLEAFGLTDVGRERTSNEDAHHCDPAHGLFVVCDGMGGHAAGEVASAHTVKVLAETIQGLGTTMSEIAAGKVGAEVLGAAMRSAIERACGELYALGNREEGKRGMGSTCTALAVAGRRAVLAHVGDSRCYLMRGGQLTQISNDHTYVAEAVRQGILRPEQAASSPYGNVITRAVGPQETVIVDLLAFDLGPGDTLMLCSDGLHQYVEDQGELAGILSRGSLESAVRSLISLANERGGSDNITTLMLRVPSNDAATSEPHSLAGIDALRHVDLLRDLTMAEVIRLCQAFVSRDVAAGEVLIREGEPGEDFYVLVEGTVEVYRGQQLITVLRKGSHFGDMALVAERPRTASIRTATPCRLLMTRRSELYPFLEGEPMLAAKFFWKLAQVLSLRLDDLYAQQQVMPLAAGAAIRETLRFGNLPPFDPPARG